MSTISEHGEENLAGTHNDIRQTEVEKGNDDIILDANREVRAKLYLGSVSMFPSIHRFSQLISP